MDEQNNTTARAHPWSTTTRRKLIVHRVIVKKREKQKRYEWRGKPYCWVVGSFFDLSAPQDLWFSELA